MTLKDLKTIMENTPSFNRLSDPSNQRIIDGYKEQVTIIEHLFSENKLLEGIVFEIEESYPIFIMNNKKDELKVYIRNSKDDAVVFLNISMDETTI